MSKIVSLTNQKGGVGKTTTSVNLAVSFAVSEVKTLLIDLDPQSNATTGLEALIEDRQGTVYDLIIGKDKISNVISSTRLDCLDIISSTNNLVGAEVELVNLMARERQLEKALKTVHKKYDYILIDCPPSLGLLTLNALTCSNSIIIPIQCEYYALEGLGQLLNTFRLVQKNLNPKLEIEGVLLTMYDSRLNLSSQVADEVRGFFKEKIFDTVIHRNVRLSEAPSFGKPALLYDANSTGAQNYLSLVEEILKHGN
ncbi:MAG: AAA family ATPase [Candidatus Neomarinimicrobiota bacterium]|nr:chromosome partitioning protein ParA [Candidatus Neomarinimicrobiota bacterium]MEC7853916.1 AAA family ATPase [Candidatus Neomarinimicrobiota bacterium]|tara:strand:- start:2118 stop:2882 length:765 start_codon:yes stop_codon:yes gene_type:complete